MKLNTDKKNICIKIGLLGGVLPCINVKDGMRQVFGHLIDGTPINSVSFKQVQQTLWLQLFFQ